jgi:hypothetical protein
MYVYYVYVCMYVAYMIGKAPDVDVQAEPLSEEDLQVATALAREAEVWFISLEHPLSCCQLRVVLLLSEW